MFFGEKAVSRTSCLEHKNGRFTYEPSVLCCMFAKKTTAAKNNCSADDFLLLPFLSRKKRKGGRFLFLKKRNKRHCGGEGSFGEKALSRTSDPIAQKNGRFPYEPSVLCSMFAKKATAAEKTVPQMTFFCFLFFLERKGREKSRVSAWTFPACAQGAGAKRSRRAACPRRRSADCKGTRRPTDSQCRNPARRH